MTTYLLEIALGPVQGFIAAARKSRDLWAGSRLLSGCARAAGKALLDGGAELIYPIESRVREESPDEDSNLSNVLLAKVECSDAAAIAAVARSAQAAARRYLQEEADRALKAWQDSGVKLREDIWQRQVADALETFAGWCRVDGDKYREAYDSTKAALGARKNTRDFAPMFEPGHELGFGVPKSSLDGVRESVLPKNRKRFPLRFGVAAGEQLDTLGCIKRVSGRQERFTALTRIAADGWLQALEPQERDELRTAYEPLVKVGFATRSEGNAGIYVGFPYDAGLLYRDRLEVARKEAAELDDAAARSALDELKGVLQPLWKAHGEPCPYAAIVVADGDRMGRFIDKATTSAQHSAVSHAIASFADQVPAIARQYRGHSVYNGGEDIMALFPLDGLVDGSCELAKAFNTAMQDVVAMLLRNDPKRDDLPSLRVGAAICHAQEPLGLIRQYGDAAEKFAKGEAGSNGQGNALGIQLHERGGHVVPWRARFDAQAGFASLKGWVAAYRQGSMPGKLAYRIRQASLFGREAGLDAEITTLEIERAIRHASERGGAGEISQAMIDQLTQRAADLAPEARQNDGWSVLIDELILARWLAARSAADLGREDH